MEKSTSSPSRKKHPALFEAANRRRLEKGQQRFAERAHPGGIAEIPLGLVDEERQVDVGKRVRRRADPSVRADEKDSANVVPSTSPATHLLKEHANASIHGGEATSEEWAFALTMLSRLKGASKRLPPFIAPLAREPSLGPRLRSGPAR